MNILKIFSDADLVIALVGYTIVFLALVLLFTFFFFLPKLLYLKVKKSKKKDDLPIDKAGIITVSGEITAAIAMGLHQFLNELHDEESGILTIKKVSKTYSPWSSKIYAVRNQFNRI
jgi:Na+-transporting methylmalonyl-CoA/oxaloacetate decarboxylase gamma subunit